MGARPHFTGCML